MSHTGKYLREEGQSRGQQLSGAEAGTAKSKNSKGLDSSRWV